MADTNFIKAIETIWPELEEGSLTSPACIAVYESFKLNVLRSTSLLAIPGYSGLTGSLIKEATIQAQRQILKDDLSESSFIANNAAITKLANDLFSKKMSISQAEQRSKLDAMTVQCEKIFRQMGTSFAPLLEGLLKSVLVQSWTSIEVMIADLWEGALNEHPSYLSTLAGEGKSDKEGKKIEIGFLERHNFDISSSMGTLLKKRFHFTVLADARSAYMQAFREGAKDVQAAIGDNSIQGLSLVRNLLVHKCGVIDEEFFSKSAPIPQLAGIRNLGVGNPAFVDGATFRTILEPALASGQNLIKSVDGWLAANKV